MRLRFREEKPASPHSSLGALIFKAYEALNPLNASWSYSQALGTGLMGLCVDHCLIKTVPENVYFHFSPPFLHSKRTLIISKLLYEELDL